jgi:replication-associated recombination protein RarA
MAKPNGSQSASLSLFESASPSGARLPLATRMRPRSLEASVGQQNLLVPGMPTRK